MFRAWRAATLCLVMPSTAILARPAHARVALAFGVALAWGMSLATTAIGRTRCTFAALLHAPCPGCGMSRAARLLLAGDVLASLRMHPLAAPTAAVTVLLAVATTRLAYREGSLMGLWKDPLGRVAVAAFALVYAALVALWVLRFAGLLGGPVPIV